MSGFVDPALFPESLHLKAQELGELHQKRQWHQLTGCLLELVRNPSASRDKNLIQVSLLFFVLRRAVRLLICYHDATLLKYSPSAPPTHT